MELKYKCIKPLSVVYNSHQGRCGDGCCSDLDSGEQEHDFEVDEVYELNIETRAAWENFYYQRDDYDIVYLSEEHIAENFEVAR